jgi:hypothetical protein
MVKSSYVVAKKAGIGRLNMCKKAKNNCFESKIGALLGDMTDTAKEKVIEDVKKAMKKEMKKEIKKEVKSKVKKKMKERRRRFIKRVVILIALCAGGYYLYTKNEKVRKTVDSALENATKYAQDKAEKVPVLKIVPFDKFSWCCKKA